ncbi:MAG: glutamate--tRNA ligase [Candidatus Latescibacteria bacterium]|nr:glutamate--tRNA ligase [Candidatus Latescibacterota bacterium]
MTNNERLRFAPSPTGDLHVGGARAALFNWLYARKTQGKFLLRIEDTDRERSTEASLKSILGSLRWLGLDWDEELVFQSKRGELYRSAVEKLLESGAAYRCFCSKEELEAERERAQREKLDYHYSGKCRNLGKETVESYVREGKPYTMRFRVGEGETSFDDHLHGVTTFRNETIGDFIIARADGSPVYILSVAVDDADMGITLVMRGDDHLSNTPKQIMLMKALGYEIPRFCHLPQVLGQDKHKLSKRHGAASVLEYEKMGFLPGAVVNFLALLGWAPGDDREKMTLDELIEAFSLDGLAKKSGVFDLQKLEWLNGQYLNDMPPEELLPLVSALFVEQGFIQKDEVDSRRDFLLGVIIQLKERCRLIPEFAEKGAFFFRAPESYDEKGERKYFNDIEVADRLEALADSFESLEIFDEASTEAATRQVVVNYNIGVGKLIHPTRLAVTGMTTGPGLFELVTLIGKKPVVDRMRRAAEYIRKNSEETNG